MILQSLIVQLLSFFWQDAERGVEDAGSHNPEIEVLPNPDNHIHRMTLRVDKSQTIPLGLTATNTHGTHPPILAANMFLLS